MNRLKSLILIDDDEIITYLAKRTITETNLVELIKVFKNGKDAIDYLKENSDNLDLLPEIILLDLYMPIMDGWEFLEEFIKIKPKIARVITIYIISSSVSPEDINRAKSISEVSDYIVKPISKENFIEIVGKA